MKPIYLLFLMPILVLGRYNDPAWATPFNSAVHFRALIPKTARTATFLGQEHEGTGMVIVAKSHVMTIGYLVLGSPQY